MQKTGLQIPKATKYEDEVAQATRTISSVVLPTLLLLGGGMKAGQALQTQVGNPLGNTAFMVGMYTIQGDQLEYYQK